MSTPPQPALTAARVNSTASVSAQLDVPGIRADAGMPAFPLGKTRLQAHREDSAFGLILSGLMISAGVILYFRNRTATKENLF